jgi:hypothetical protein
MKKLLQKLILLMTAVAFMAGSLGFIGCSGGIEEDPDAAANASKEVVNPNDDVEEDPDAQGEGEEGISGGGGGGGDDDDDDE